MRDTQILMFGPFEVRVMLHRFFILYAKMEDLPEKLGFFSRGLLIRSDLSGVPSGILAVVSAEI